MCELVNSDTNGPKQINWILKIIREAAKHLHLFNCKIYEISLEINGFEKYAPSPEIWAKMCQILLVQFGMLILDSLLVITWDLVRIFQNLFLR